MIFSELQRYIKNAFYVFRRTVNRYLLAPHYAVDGAYEWPVPSKFSWGDLKIVNAVGEFLEGEIPRKNDNVKVEVREGEWVNQKEVDPLTGFMKESSREFVSGKDDFEEVFKYRIEDISRVGYVFSNDWQNSSLRKYVCPLSRFITNHSRGEISEQKGSWMMTNFLKNIAREYIN